MMTDQTNYSEEGARLTMSEAPLAETPIARALTAAWVSEHSPTDRGSLALVRCRAPLFLPATARGFRA